MTACDMCTYIIYMTTLHLPCETNQIQNLPWLHEWRAVIFPPNVVSKDTLVNPTD
uniref:E3 ubiquitin-protein ligase UPL2 n=1 Tax=Rhizophora mucronata TaxID=61149 RepID=A0A2P2MUX2_RHIMU